MNCSRETVKMGVPARHREPARSGEAGGRGGRATGQPSRDTAGLDPRRT
jgi:hypothetical protein